MFSHNDAERAVQNLKINIPETYWNDSEIFYIYNGSSILYKDANNYNMLKMIRNRKDFSYLDEVLKIEELILKRTFNPIDPLLIVRTKYSDFQNNKTVESYERAKEKLKDTGDGITQRFIRSKGKNRELM
jgi:hypothetical protein